MSSKKPCNKCRGTGHDNGGRPRVDSYQHKDPETGETKTKYRTVHVGSGCMKCLGRAFV